MLVQDIQPGFLYPARGPLLETCTFNLDWPPRRLCVKSKRPVDPFSVFGEH